MIKYSLGGRRSRIKPLIVRKSDIRRLNAVSLFLITLENLYDTELRRLANYLCDVDKDANSALDETKTETKMRRRKNQRRSLQRSG